MVRAQLDLEDYCRQSVRFEKVGALTKYGREKLENVRQALFRESNVYAEGWFGGLYKALADLKLYEVRFDHTQFGKANTFRVLREFVFFLAAAGDRDVYLDIFQSEVPDLTEVFWMLPTVFSTKWGDVECTLPPSILGFERTANVRIGDTGAWKKMKSEVSTS